MERKSDTNVIEFEQAKLRRQLRQTQEEYGSYLQGLDQNQLEFEIYHLLDEFSSNNFGYDFFLKGKLILREIGDRAEGSTKAKILKMHHDLGQKFEGFFEGF